MSSCSRAWGSQIRLPCAVRLPARGARTFSLSYTLVRILLSSRESLTRFQTYIPKTCPPPYWKWAFCKLLRLVTQDSGKRKLPKYRLSCGYMLISLLIKGPMIYSDYVVRQVRLIAWFHYLIDFSAVKNCYQVFLSPRLRWLSEGGQSWSVSENAFRTRAWEEVIFICDWNDDAF